MNKGIIVIVLIAALYFVFPQEAEAADLPSGLAPAKASSAYVILGLVPAEDESPVYGNQAELEATSNPESQVPVQLEGQVVDTIDKPVDPLAPETEIEPVDAEPLAPVSEIEPIDAEPLILEADVEPADAELPAEEAEAEPEVEQEEEPLVDERRVPEGEADLDTVGASPDIEDLAEPGEEAPPAALEDAIEVADEASEDALMAEVLRLMEERDVLNETIRGLREENILLSAKAEEADFYKSLAENLEQKIAELEVRLADTELALAESTDALMLAEAGLEAYDETVRELESSLEISETSLKDTRAYLVLFRDELAKAQDQAQDEAQDEVQPEETTGEASSDGKLEALAAERDAAFEARSQAEAARKAAEAARTAAEVSRAATEAVLAEALETGIVMLAPGKASAEATNGYLSGWSLDTTRFTKVIRSDLSDSVARMGSWVIQGAGARQTDASQYFSRLELPLAQDGKPLLYSFKARATGAGWVGLGLHFFVEDVVKRRGYGEGKSLLVWFTRDQVARGVDTTYLQLYRSDNDVVMERMFDAAIGDSMIIWRKVDIVYDPVAEYVAVSVDGVLRIVYKTFFGRTSGATMALRTLGGGVEFADFSVRGE
ncbi:MAG: hypothetical protein ABIJ86_01950 [Spirochaetota bacterium]